MKPTAIVFMLTVWGCVLSMVVYCYYKMLSQGRRLDNDAPDSPSKTECRPGGSA